eukprot:TRINITY_DN5189_c0_g1_i1.p1 TRINITY_DN5189_c0_g1~~TRINITY_DN5189_c0_g1_i1.p1  ORF type:complete len:293 (+),score=47.00 TRINITY_DN5189_c0_g1_i1:124-1002(+)
MGTPSNAHHVWEPHKASASGGKSSAFQSAVILSFLFIVYGFVCLFSDFIVQYVGDEGRNITLSDLDGRKFGNALYQPDEVKRLFRRWELLGLTQREADFGRRMVASGFLGTLIGIERRAPNRPAGVRTMAMVSLGACLFTICSAYNFEEGSQEWDASRISAALPSGVGFLGGAVIFKDKADVIGLTTATGIWAACAVGTACGGAMYFVAAFATAGMVAMLRFGPRRFGVEGADDEESLGACGPSAIGEFGATASTPFLATGEDGTETPPGEAFSRRQSAPAVIRRKMTLHEE